jgi:hypothetical protein
MRKSAGNNGFKTRISVPDPGIELGWHLHHLLQSVLSKMAALQTFLFTSESVNEGHPDKLADQVCALQPQVLVGPPGESSCSGWPPSSASTAAGFS